MEAPPSGWALPESQIDRLFREIGSSIHMAQVLEVSLRAMIAMAHRGRSPEAVEDLILSEDRRALGPLIRELGEVGSLNQTAADALDAALDARNYVAHHFFIRHVHAFNDQHAYEAALSVLEAKQFEIAKATAIMSGLTKGIAAGMRTRVVVRQDTPPPQQEAT